MPPSCALLADLQSVHGLRCYGNITRTRNVSEYVLVLALCLVKQLRQNSPRNQIKSGSFGRFLAFCLKATAVLIVRVKT